MSGDSNHKLGSDPPLGARGALDIAEVPSSPRVTAPEFAERTPAACVPELSAEAADASADSIRPAWEEPSFRMLRAPAERDLQERELTPAPDPAGDDAIVVNPPALLSGDAADAYAALIEPSWGVAPAWTTPPSPIGAPSTQVMPLMTSTSDPWAEQPQHDWVQSDKTPPLRAALILTGCALLGAAAGALLALAPHPERSAPAAEKTRASALIAEPAADRSSTQARATTATSDTIRVRIATEPRGATILLDGVEVPNPFDAQKPRGGKHRVLVRADGRTARELTLTFERDEDVRVSLDPPVPSAP